MRETSATVGQPIEFAANHSCHPVPDPAGHPMIIGTFGLANMRSSAEGGSITFKPMRKEAPFQVAGPYRLGPRRSRGYLAQADKALPHKGKTRSMKILWIRNPQSKDYRGMALLGVDECDGPADSSFGAQATCKPGSVGDSHSSGTDVTISLKQPTRPRYGPHQ